LANPHCGTVRANLSAASDRDVKCGGWGGWDVEKFVPGNVTAIFLQYVPLERPNGEASDFCCAPQATLSQLS